MITPNDLQDLASVLVERHGPKAVFFADCAVDEMEALGDEFRADAWRALKSLVEDVIEGRDIGATLTIQ